MSFNMNSLFLEGLHNGEAHKEIKFLKKTSILGRGAPPVCDIALTSKIMSKKHCTIEFRNNHMHIKDLKSANGTYVNDAKIELEVKLEVNDRIGFGCNPEKLEINKDKQGFLMYIVKEETIELVSSEEDASNPSAASPPLFSEETDDEIDELLKYIEDDAMMEALAKQCENDVIELSDDEIKLNTWKEKLSQSQGRRSPLLSQTNSEPSERSHQRSESVAIFQPALLTLQPGLPMSPPSSPTELNEPPSSPTELSEPEEDSCVLQRQEESSVPETIQSVPEAVQEEPEKKLIVIIKKLTIEDEQLAEYSRLQQESSDGSYLSSDSEREIYHGLLRRKTLPSTKVEQRRAEKVRKKIAEIANSDSDSDGPSTSSKPQRKRRKQANNQSPTQEQQLQSQNIPKTIDSSLQAPLGNYKIPKKGTVASTSKQAASPPPRRMSVSSRDPVEPDMFAKAAGMRRRRLSMLRSSIDAPVETSAEKEKKKKIQEERNEKLRKLAEKEAAQKEKKRLLEAKKPAPSHVKVTEVNRGDFLTKLPDKLPVPRRPSISELARRPSISEAARPSISEAPTVVADSSAQNGSQSNLPSEPMEVSTETEDSSGICNNESLLEINNNVEANVPSRAGFYNQIGSLPTAPQLPLVFNAAGIIVASILKLPAPKSNHKRQVHFKENEDGEIEETVKMIESREEIKEMETLTDQETPESSPDDKKLTLDEYRSRVNECEPTISSGISVESHSSAPTAALRSVPAATISTPSAHTLTTEQECVNRILAWNPLAWDPQEQAIIVVHPPQRPINPIKMKFDSIEEYKFILRPIIEFDLKTSILETFNRNTKHEQSWIKSTVTGVSKKYFGLTELTLTSQPRDSEAMSSCKRSYQIGALLVLKSSRLEIFFGYVTRFENQADKGFSVTVQAMINFQLDSVIKTFLIDVIFPHILPLVALKELKDSAVLQHLMDPTKIKVINEFNDGKMNPLGVMTKSQVLVFRKVHRLLHDTRREMPLLVIEGGPGTGKTRTIAAAVMQIINSSEARPNILVCAKSHKCLDDIAKSLLAHTKHMNIKITRIGQPYRIGESVREISLHQQAKRLLALQHFPQSTSFHDSEQIIVHGANIILTTIYSSFELKKMNKTYDICLIDEASTFNDAQLLIPLQLGFKKLVLVGDKSSCATRLEDSFFARILHALKQKAYDPTMTLVEQFRMDPAILQFPNAEFLNSALNNHFLLSNRKLKIYPPYQVINMTTDTESISEEFNIAAFVRAVGKPLSRFTSIAVVTTDWKHMEEVRKNLGNQKEVEFFTIDSIQGIEKDIVIIYLPSNQHLGGFATRQRLTVALTRARLALYICGNFDTLKAGLKLNPLWDNLIKDAKAREVFIDRKETSLRNFVLTQRF